MEENTLKEMPVVPRAANRLATVLPAVAMLVIIGAGAASGYWFATKGGLPIGPSTTKELLGGVQVVEGPQELGIKDEKAFPDNTSGKLEVNSDPNITEGSHKLLRPGGASQTAYLTSSVVDLNQFVGKCVQVWGQTFAAQKVGWLMDVGRIKRLDSCPAGI